MYASLYLLNILLIYYLSLHEVVHINIPRWRTVLNTIFKFFSFLEEKTCLLCHIHLLSLADYGTDY